MSLFGSKENSGKPDAAGGAFFWFGWKKISDAGYSMYGQYVYGLMLPLIAEHSKSSAMYWSLFDGDCFVDELPAWPVQGPEDTAVKEEVARIGPRNFYAIGMFGSPDAYRDLERDLRAPTGPFDRTEPAIGFHGMTTTGSLDWQQFLDLREALALVPSLRIEGSRLKKIDFGFFTDEALESLGFKVDS